MTIPIARKFYRPVLEIADKKGDIWGYSQMVDALVEHFALTEDDLQEMVPSGSATRVRDRTEWAVGDLARAGLLDRPARGRFQINQDGRQYLNNLTGDVTAEQQQKLKAMNKNLRIPPIDGGEATQDKLISSVEEVSETTPSELIATAYAELEAQLVGEILDRLSSIDPHQFEQFVVALLEKMGYGEGRQVGRSGDGGIDGIINQDPLGLEKVYIQAKRWQNQVGEPEIRNFSGSLEARGANKGVFIATSSFSTSAIETARFISAGNKFVRLIDGSELARLMINHNVGVVPETRYVIKKLDENYFADEI